MIEKDSKFCQEYENQPKTEQNVIRKGIIKCDCGQEFYFETTKDYIACIKCKKIYDVRNFPIEEVEDDGTDV